MHNIHDIISRCSKKNLYLTRSDKLGMKNSKFRIINQNRNVIYHVQSLKNNFYLGAFGSFDCVFTHT